MNESVKQALIGGIASVIVAAITALAQTKATLESEKPTFVEEATRRVESAVSGVPIGTVVASMLAPKDFAKLVGDDTNFNPTKAKWVPADGRSVAGSKYASAATTTAPDVRGLFIRSLNYSEPDRNRSATDPTWSDEATNRLPGSLQADSIKAHTAASTGQHQVLTGNSGFWALSSQPYNTPGAIAVGGGAESRPKNIALFHYVKIN